MVKFHTTKKEATDPDSRITASNDLHTLVFDPIVHSPPVLTRSKSCVLLVGAQDLLLKSFQRNDDAIASDSVPPREREVTPTANGKLCVGRCQDAHDQRYIVACFRRYKTGWILFTYCRAAEVVSSIY